MTDLVASQSWLEHCFANNLQFAESEWLAAFRESQLKKAMKRGMPSRKEELWKYTDAAAHLANKNFSLPQATKKTERRTDLVLENEISIVFVNGKFSETLSNLTDVPKEVTICALSAALNKQEQLLKPYLLQAHDEKRFPFAVLNAGLLTDGLFVCIPKNYVLQQPIHLLYLQTQENDFIVSPRNIVIADKSSQVTLIEEYVGEQAQHYFCNVVTELHADENAEINYCKIQDEDNTATHIANVFIQQQQDSRVNTAFFSRGGKLEREDVTVYQTASGAESKMLGLYALHQDQQHVDHHLHVDHAAPRGVSSMIYKGILDKKSRAVFNGKVHVQPAAQQIQAHQANHNLLLSKEAEVNSKPELEIYADDVKCTHGATIGQMDDEARFYLRSRGIPDQDAFKILTRAFADEVFAKIDNVAIRQYVQKRMVQHEEL